MFIKSFLLIFVLLATENTVDAATDKVICFFASWAVYRGGDGAFRPQNIDPNLCSHVFYAFLGVNPDGSLEMLDPWNDVNLGALAKVASLKDDNPDLKVLISIGGYNAGNAILNGVVASSKLRANLISSSVEFFEKWGYDGLDISWEYPTISDKTNFVKLLTEMSATFEKDGYILSVTVAGTPLSSYNIPELSKLADLLNVMTYDFHTSAEGRTGLNSPLYGPQSVNTSITSWLNEGADKSKLTLAIPFYGRTYSLVSENSHGVGVPAGTGIGGPYTKSPGSLAYNEICLFYEDWIRVWDDEAQVPYKYDGSNWLSYDDEQSVGLKAKYAKDKGLAGVMVWSLDYDDFLGECGTENVLLQAIRKSIS